MWARLWRTDVLTATDYARAMQYDVFLADCPARTTLEVIGGTWAAVVITALSERPRRYSELSDRIGGISRKVLTEVLRRLERDGLVVRTTASSDAPATTHYRLTDLGLSAVVPVQALVAWAEAHTEDVLAAREM
jgi:DNA-binding HxlR family transcriptional regulator